MRLRLRLGEFLIEKGLLTQEQLTIALENQLIYGGRLGTNLVELNFVGIEELNQSLQELMGVPVVSTQDLEKASPEALALLSGRYCSDRGLLPLRLEGEQVHVAMLTPSEENITSLSLMLDAPIVPYVIAELRLHYYIEKHYLVERPSRFLRLPESGEESDHRRQYLRSTVIPASHGVAWATAGASDPDDSKAIRIRYLPLEELQYEPLEVFKEELMLMVKEVEPAGERTPLRVFLEQVESPVGASGAPESHGISETRPVHEALRKLDLARSGADVAEALVEPLCDETATSILFWVRRDMAVACCAKGQPTHEFTEPWFIAMQSLLSQLVVSLKNPSLFQWGAALQGALHTKGSSDVVQSEIATFLATYPPGEVCVAPVFLGPQLVNLICVHSRPDQRFPDTLINDLAELARRTPAAYARLRARACNELSPSAKWPQDYATRPDAGQSSRGLAGSLSTD